MRTLAIDCATEACSAAVFEGGRLLSGQYEVIGRGHAERLVPLIAGLPDKGRATRILVSLGPGSFTGVRIGLAAARALGLAWQAQVLGYPTLALVAAMARQAHCSGPGAAPVSVCMTGGHGEYFVQDFAADGLPQGPLASVAPDRLGAHGQHHVIAGSQAQRQAAALCNGASDTAALSPAFSPARIALEILPDARHALLVPDRLLTSALTPLYGRAPDARLPGTGT